MIAPLSSVSLTPSYLWLWRALGWFVWSLVSFGGVSVPLRAEGQLDEQQFKVIGQKKTDAQFLHQSVSSCHEKIHRDNKGKTVEEDQLRQCLLNLKIFSEINIEREGNNWLITVDEKWSIIPLPILEIGGKNYKIGLFVLETNFLGKAKALVFGGIKTSNGQNLYLFYRDHNFWSSPIAVTQYLIQTNEEWLNVEGETITDGFFVRRRDLGIDTLWTTDYGGIGPTIALAKLEFSGVMDFDVPKNNRFFKYGVAYNWSNDDYLEFYESGHKVSWRYMHESSRADGAPLTSYSKGRYNYGIGIGEQMAFQVQLDGGVAWSAQKFDSYFLGGNVGYRGIPSRQAWARRYLSLANSFQFRLLQGRLGSLTLSPFYDYGLIDLNGGSFSRVLYQSWGVGSYFYLKQVALPGFGLEIGNNPTYGGGFLQLNIGVRI